MKKNKPTLTILAENTVRTPGLIGEHGLSLWLETAGGCILFDTGQGLALSRNAETLEIDLHSPQAIVVSHGHYDHTGGLRDALARAPEAELFLHPSALSPRFSRRDGATREIGMPRHVRQAVNQRVAPTVWTTAPCEVLPGVFLTGPIPRANDFEDTGGSFFLAADGTLPDPVEDDQALWIEGADGVTVVLGCAHAGVVNTLRHIERLAGKRPIHSVIGGMHLANADETRMAKTIEILRTFNLRWLLPIHCTGFVASARLWQAFPACVTPCHAGDRIEL